MGDPLMGDEALRKVLGDAGLMTRLAKVVKSDSIELPFVNREQEVRGLSTSLINNSINAARNNTNNQDFDMPFLPQMFGSGKTTLGKHLLQRANILRGEILQELQTLYPSHKELVKEQVDKFLQATYVHISLDMLPDTSSKFPDLSAALRSLIRKALNKVQITQHNPPTTEDISDIGSWVAFLAGGHSVVLQFDDVGSLLHPEKYGGYFVGTDSMWEMRRMYRFWDEIHHLNKMDGIYCFMSGKRSALLFLGQKLLRQYHVESPTGAVSTILGMFTPHHIQYLAANLHLWDKLEIADERLQEGIVKALHRLTGGVPRLVTFAMRVLDQGAGQLGALLREVDRNALRAVMRDLLYRVFTHAGRSTVLASSEALASPTTADLYLRLLAMSLQGKVINPDTKLEFKDTVDSVPLSVLISAVDCFVERAPEVGWRLLFPELVLRWVADNPRAGQRLTFFAKSILEDPDIADPGAVNEKIFRLSLETLLSHDTLEPSSQARPLGEVLPFLVGTQLAGWRLRMQPNGFTPLPKIKRDERTKRLSVADRNTLAPIVSSKPMSEWVSGIRASCGGNKRKDSDESNAEALERFVQTAASWYDSDFILFNMLRDEHLGCSVSSESAWPDFVIVEHQQPAPATTAPPLPATAGMQASFGTPPPQYTSAPSTATPRPTPAPTTAPLSATPLTAPSSSAGHKLGAEKVHYALWWQIKLFGEKTQFSWFEVQKEIDKVPLVADHQCLVIVSTHLDSGIAERMADGTHLLIQKGFGKGEGRRPSGKGKKSKQEEGQGKEGGEGKKGEKGEKGKKGEKGMKGDLLNVPDNLEVVILGPKGLAQVYSEYDLDGLYRLARANTFASISQRLTQPTMSLGGTSLPMLPPIPGRTIKLTFVDNAQKAIVGNGMADIPFGTPLVSAKDMISTVLSQRKPALSGRRIVGLKWLEVSIEQDCELERLKDGHEIVVLLE